MASSNTISIKASDIDEITIKVLSLITFTGNNTNIEDIKNFETRVCWIEKLLSAIIHPYNMYLILVANNLIKKSIHHNSGVRSLIDVLAHLKKLKLRSVHRIRPSNI